MINRLKKGWNEVFLKTFVNLQSEEKFEISTQNILEKKQQPKNMCPTTI